MHVLNYIDTGVTLLTLLSVAYVKLVPPNSQTFIK
jgi:hypothetical protein